MPRTLQRAISRDVLGGPAAQPQPVAADRTSGGRFEPVSPTTHHENALLRTTANAGKGHAVAPLDGARNREPVNMQRNPQPTAVEPTHPETVCRRCGGPNVSWFAPSPLWNAVMRGGSIDGPQEFGELICPTCFAVLAQERGVAWDWRLDARTISVELETVTPSGRVWDSSTDLWGE